MNAPWRTRFDGSSELPTQVDVTIIGGGIAGCATALYLAREGVSVCVLERQQLGEGATGRCLGLPWLGLGDSPIRLERAMGAAATDRVLQLCLENRALLSEFASLAATPTTWIALDEREAEEIAASRAILNRNQVPFVASQLNVERIKASLQLLESGPIHPGSTLTSIANQASEHGATFCLHTPAQTLEQGSFGTRIGTPKGDICSDAVVFAAGAWLPSLHAWFQDKVVAVREHAQAGPISDTSGPTAFRGQYGHILGTQLETYWALAGCRWASGHLEVGETDDSVSLPEIQAALDRFRTDTWGGKDAPTHRWAYLWANTCDGLPIIGPLPGDPTWVSCTGFMGNDWGFGLRAARAVSTGLLHGMDNAIPEWMTPTRFV